MSSHQFAARTASVAAPASIQAIPLVVQGVGAMREPYQEQVSTLSISCHGCTYQSKHEVIQGETVYLDIKPPNEGSAGCSSRARVKWAQKLGAQGADSSRSPWSWRSPEISGASPPRRTIGFHLRLPEAIEAAAPGRELKVVARKEQPAVPAPEDSFGSGFPTREKPMAATSSIAPLAQLMVGLGEQIQIMAIGSGGRGSRQGEEPVAGGISRADSSRGGQGHPVRDHGLQGGHRPPGHEGAERSA